MSRSASRQSGLRVAFKCSSVGQECSLRLSNLSEQIDKIGVQADKFLEESCAFTEQVRDHLGKMVKNPQAKQQKIFEIYEARLAIELNYQRQIRSSPSPAQYFSCQREMVRQVSDQSFMIPLEYTDALSLRLKKLEQSEFAVLDKTIQKIQIPPVPLYQSYVLKNCEEIRKLQVTSMRIKRVFDSLRDQLINLQNTFETDYLEQLKYKRYEEVRAMDLLSQTPQQSFDTHEQYDSCLTQIYNQYLSINAQQTKLNNQFRKRINYFMNLLVSLRQSNELKLATRVQFLELALNNVVLLVCSPDIDQQLFNQIQTSELQQCTERLASIAKTVANRSEFQRQMGFEQEYSAQLRSCRNLPRLIQVVQYFTQMQLQWDALQSGALSPPSPEIKI